MSEKADAEFVEFEAHPGVALRGDAWGPADGSPVVLLHGGGQTRHSWSGTGARLGAEGWRAVSLDLRGHGESDWSPDGRYGIEPFLADLVHISRNLSQKPVLVGASLGGIASLLAEGESPGLARALVMVDVTPRLERKGVDRIIDFMTAQPDGFASLDEAAEAVSAYRSHRSKPTDRSGLLKNLRLGEDGRYRWHWDPAFIGMRQEGAVHQPDRLLDAARALTLPTLLIRGRESDVVSRDGADEFLAAAAHARFVDVSGAGHMVAGDRNDAFTEAVVDFLAELRGG
jgi:pimeloyl-ACP methyl ester carboxylesterase